MSSFLKVRNLSYISNNKLILDNISFKINKGDICGILGPNGSGKSTLFKCMLNLLDYKYGDVLVNEKIARKLSPGKLSKKIAYVPQEIQVIFPFTVFQIILMGRTPYLEGSFAPSDEDKELVCDAMKLFNLFKVANRSFNELSGGEKQLVLIARSIIQDTPIIVMDEPSASLDYSNQHLLWEVVSNLKKQGKTVLISTHEPNHILRYCNKVLLLKKGQKVDFGEPFNVINEKSLLLLYNRTFSILEKDKIKIDFPSN